MQHFIIVLCHSNDSVIKEPTIPNRFGIDRFSRNDQFKIKDF